MIGNLFKNGVQLRATYNDGEELKKLKKPKNRHLGKTLKNERTGNKLKKSRYDA